MGQIYITVFGEKMKVKVENLCEKEVLDRGIRNWPNLEKEAYFVDWYYDQIQDCLIFEGETLVETEDGKMEFRQEIQEQIPAWFSYLWKKRITKKLLKK